MSGLTVQLALADQIRDAQIGDALGEGLQVSHLLITFPTPPCIDIFPNEEYQIQEAFGKANTVIYLDVRARVNTPDHDGAQELLLALMDPTADTSIQKAINADPTLNGEAESAFVSAGPKGFGIYPSVDPGVAGYTGCLWTVRVTL